MEKHVAKWSYFGGLIAVLVACLWRVLVLVGVMRKELTGDSHTLTYDSVLKAGLMLLAVTVATAAYSYLQRGKSGSA